jgi:exopolyphosphatase / guanosine-5'-triphosphate,3'-diphosphate pyrophosphatase
MTTTERAGQPHEVPVVPRWEWRTFGVPEEPNEDLRALREAPPFESDEVYVVSQATDASVKVRAGLLDVKVLRAVDGAGLQLWVPVTKAAFPVDADTVGVALGALGVPAVTTPGPSNAYDDIVARLDARDDLRRVKVHKSRHRSVLDGCMVEYTELVGDGHAVVTVAVESPDQALVLRTVDRLGLSGRRNTCVARGLRTLLGWEATRFAVLDVGTNSVKFIAGERRPDAAPVITSDTAVVTRLGEGLADTGDLTGPAMQRTVDAIATLVDGVRGDGPVEVAAVGTAGLRQAGNRDDFLEAVVARCGVAVEVVSGPEEARLAYRAATSTLPVAVDRLLVFDSGGGSSQFTFGSGSAIEDQFSLDIGAVRITERYGLGGPVERSVVDAALAAVAGELEAVAGRPRPDAVIAIGGTSTNLAGVYHALTTYDPDVVHGTVIDLAEVDRQIELFRQASADERRGIAGLQPARAEVILAGACIVRTILTLTRQESLTVSDRGLRHGVVAERFAPQSSR